jgi:hypothetical protein
MCLVLRVLCLGDHGKVLSIKCATVQHECRLHRGRLLEVDGRRLGRRRLINVDRVDPGRSRQNRYQQGTVKDLTFRRTYEKVSSPSSSRSDKTYVKKSSSDFFVVVVAMFETCSRVQYRAFTRCHPELVRGQRKTWRS